MSKLIEANVGESSLFAPHFLPLPPLLYSYLFLYLLFQKSTTTTTTKK